jgi:hypothetical protein
MALTPCDGRPSLRSLRQQIWNVFYPAVNIFPGQCVNIGFPAALDVHQMVEAGIKRVVVHHIHGGPVFGA